jgi:hypothetical protein
MTVMRWRYGSRGSAVVIGVSTAVLAGVAILVAALFFGAGLHCIDRGQRAHAAVRFLKRAPASRMPEPTVSAATEVGC